MATRYDVPDAEAKYPWLKVVLDTYYISDAQVEEHLRTLSKKGIVPACHKGCHSCCLRATVPFTEPELATISWFASERLTGETRERVKQRLFEHELSTECPFLLDRSCTIYPVRPLICRQFLVANQVCTPDENVLETRRQDIIPLSREAVIRPVAMRLLDYFKFKSSIAKKKAFESGFIHHNAKDMHDYDWKIIANSMTHFDNEA